MLTFSGSNATMAFWFLSPAITSVWWGFAKCSAPCAMWGNCSPETAHRSGTDLLGVTGGGKNEDIPAEFETMFASPRSEKAS